ncbi:hypothetical protein KDL45_17445, partial [bacterium]|nr:hypothetical protein [bacterium]
MRQTRRKFPRIARNDRRGVVMIVVMVVLMLTLLVGMGGMVVASTDLKITANYRTGAQAFFAAEAGVQNAIAELRENNEWTAGIPSTAQANGTSYEVTVDTLSGQIARLVSRGQSGNSLRIIEVVVNIDSAFDHALNVGGDLLLAGKPRVSSEGVRLNGDAYLDLDSGTPDLNIYAPSTSTINFVDGSNTNPVHRYEKEALDLSAAKLSDEDWVDLAHKAPVGYSYDSDGIMGNGDTPMTINNLNFNNVPEDADGKRAIYVDGDLVLHGAIQGIGTIICTGKIIGAGISSGNGTTVSLISKDDVLLDFASGGNQQNFLNGLTYAEGDYELHGKIKYTGVVTAFGTVTVQNPSEFSNNSDPNFWYTYSSAYN